MTQHSIKVVVADGEEADGSEKRNEDGDMSEEKYCECCVVVKEDEMM